MATADEIKIRIIAKDEASKVFNQTKLSSEKLKSSITALKASFLGLSVAGGAFLKSIIDTGSQVQNLQVRMKFLTGSTRQGTQAFQAMLRYASKVPFALEDIQLGVPSLLTVSKGTGELNELLEMTGDLAAASGLSFQETSMQMQRALAGGIASAELFRERGISAMLGFEAGVSYSAEKTKEKLISAFRDGTTTVKGATAELAKTFTGEVSMMQDAWFNLKNELAQTGILEEATNVVKSITEGIKDPKFQEGMKTFTSNMLDLFKFMVTNADKVLAIGAIWFGAKLGGVLGKKGAIAGGALAALIAGLKELGLLGKWFKDSFDPTTASLDSLKEKLPELEAEVLKAKDALDKLYERQRTSNARVDPFFPTQKEINAAMLALKKARGEAAYIRALISGKSDRKKPVMATDLVPKDADTEKAVDYWGAMAKGVDEYAKKMGDLEEATKAAAFNGMKRLEDSLVDFAMGAKSAKDAFKDMARAIISDIMRIYIRQQLLGGIQTMGGGTGILGSIGGAIFGQSFNTSTVATADGATLYNPNLDTFAGGGFTGRGSRSGGVDGKGGFPAILHPNETVIDHAQGQTGGVVVNQTINVSTGVQQTVRTEIASLMPQIADAAKGAVLDARRRGGSFAKGFGV